MRIHTRLLLPTLGGLAVLALLMGWQGQRSIKGLADQQQQDLFQARRMRMEILLADLAAAALEEASLFRRLPQMQEILRRSISGDPQDPADPASDAAREEMRRFLAPDIEGGRSLNPASNTASTSSCPTPTAGCGPGVPPISWTAATSATT